MQIFKNYSCDHELETTLNVKTSWSKNIKYQKFQLLNKLANWCLTILNIVECCKAVSQKYKIQKTILVLMNKTRAIKVKMPWL
jgi:hypothetical protein